MKKNSERLTQDSERDRALELFGVAKRGIQAHKVGEWLDEVDRESLSVLLSLHGIFSILSRDSTTPMMASSVGHLIDLRIKASQEEASDRLRGSMETVSGTLERVEKLQRKMERVGIAVAVVGTVVALVTGWAAWPTDKPGQVVIVESIEE